MKNALYIFRRDVRRLLRSPAAMLVVLGVCVLPSLYAWFNIAANIDPYANTGDIKIAVASLDRGADAAGQNINAGEQIIENLKENKQLGWVFTDEESAINGVRSGKYYASVIIPEDFSSSLTDVLSGNIQPARLDYYINEKSNAIAPKITETGAGAIQTQVSSTFSSIAAQSVSETLKNSASEISETVDNSSSRLLETLSQAEENLQKYEKSAEDFQRHTGDAAAFSTDIQNAVSSLKSASSAGSASLTETDTVMKKMRNATGSFSSALSSSLSEGETLIGEVNTSVSSGLSMLEARAHKINGSVGTALNSAKSTVELNNIILSDLQGLLDQISGGEVSSSPVLDGLQNALNDLNAQNQRSQELINSLISSNTGISDAIDASCAARQSLDDASSQNIAALHALRSSFDKDTMPLINSTLDSFSSLSGELTGILSGVPATADQLSSVLAQLGTSLDETQDALGRTGDALARVRRHLSDVKTDIAALTGSQAYEKLISLKNVDTDAISSFMESPVKISTKSFYQVKNYGSSMTPFYTNLAIWVGGIILIAIFKLEADRNDRTSHCSASALYFGRWLLYVALGLIQGFIVSLGDIFLPGVQCISPAAFVFTGMICSFVYVNIIYALSLTFKHIGKALCVLLVILQIPGSSGTYPVEMTPDFFQNIHPFLPFTYGVNAMRECVAGMFGNLLAKNLAVLILCFVPLSLLIGLVIRPRLSGLNCLFDESLSRTEFMICEHSDDRLSRRTRMTLLLNAALSAKDTLPQTAQKAQVFERRYRKMIHAGFAAILIIPLVFLVLMFSLESKIIFLILWILSIIVIAAWMIILEYIHTRLEEQQKLSGMTFEDILLSFQGKENS